MVFNYVTRNLDVSVRYRHVSTVGIVKFFKVFPCIWIIGGSHISIPNVWDTGIKKDATEFHYKVFMSSISLDKLHFIILRPFSLFLEMPHIWAAYWGQQLVMKTNYCSSIASTYKNLFRSWIFWSVICVCIGCNVTHRTLNWSTTVGGL